MRVAALLCAAALTACGTTASDPSPSPSPAPSTQTPVPSETSSGQPQPTDGTPDPTRSTASCPAFGSTADATSADPAQMSSLTGAEIRVGQDPCYDRFVFQLQGTGGMPGWRVGYRDPLLADPSGEPVQLRGSADLEVVVRVWTWTGNPGPDVLQGQLPFTGPDQISTQGFTALQEARIISSFEGVTQIGLGIDAERPFKVFAMDGPPRLVVDIANS